MLIQRPSADQLEKRILIFGNSGSGKSTLAKAYGARFGLAHLDLDSLAWQATEIPTRRLASDSLRDIQRFTEANTQWVIEGCYADLLALLTSEASECIFLNPGVEQCIANCQGRPWEPHKYRTVKEQNDNLAMLIEWVKNYAQREDEFSLQAHRELYQRFDGAKQQVGVNIDLSTLFD